MTTSDWIFYPLIHTMLDSSFVLFYTLLLYLKQNACIECFKSVHIVLMSVEGLGLIDEYIWLCKNF